MANGIRTGEPLGFNNGRSSKFREGSRVRQTPEEGRRTYRPKRCGNNNKDEDNSLKTLNDKKWTTWSLFFFFSEKNRLFWRSFSLKLCFIVNSLSQCIRPEIRCLTPKLPPGTSTNLSCQLHVSHVHTQVYLLREINFSPQGQAFLSNPKTQTTIKKSIWGSFIN